MKNQKNEYFIIDVRQGSDILLRDYRVFFQCVKLKRCQITSCYERRATQGVVVSSLTGRWTKGGAMMRVVTQECATFCFPANAIHMQLGIDVDHSNMVKFSDGCDHCYTTVRDRLSKCVRNAPGIVEARLQSAARGNHDGMYEYWQYFPA